MSHLEEVATTELLQRLPPVELDDVAVRRLRQSVLADAALAVRPSGARPVQRAWSAGLPAVVALAAVGAVLWSPRQEQAKDTFAVLVRSSDRGPIRWSRHLDASTERVDLLDGAFRVEVHGGENRHAVIGVPDGRIEDLGTTFEVRVEAGRTTRVHVEEGQVAVWVRGGSALLSAGETWQQAPRQVAAAPVTSAPVPPAFAAHRPRPRPATGHLAEEAAAEDAAYLEILHLLRATRPTEAREAARQYLRRFPDAFRRAEVERLTK